MRRYIHNFNWLFLDKIIRIFGGLFIGIWVARYLGPNDFGIYSFAMAFVAFFSFFSTLGLNSIIVREITKNESHASQIIGTAFYLKILGGFVAFIVGCIAIFVYKPSDIVSQTLIALLLLGYIFQAVDVIDYFFQAKVLSKYVVFARSIAFVAASILKIYFIIFQYSLIYFAIASLVEIILGALFMYLVYKQLGLGLSDWEMNRSVSKKLLRDSWPLMLSAFFITIYMKIDQVMIESFLDMQSVGLYSVAVRLAEAWYFVPTIIISTVMPYFVNLKETNTDMYNYRLRQINTLMVWMSIMVGIIFTFFGEYIIILMFGESYKDAYIPLSLSIWAGIFVSVGLSSSLWVISENLQIYRLIGTMISVGLNVLGNYILIPIYGISGAAIATLITQGIGLWVIPLFFKPMRQFTIMSITSILPIYLLKGKK